MDASDIVHDRVVGVPVRSGAYGVVRTGWPESRSRTQEPRMRGEVNERTAAAAHRKAAKKPRAGVLIRLPLANLERTSRRAFLGPFSTVTGRH